jgi:hypothetical protein
LLFFQGLLIAQWQKGVLGCNDLEAIYPNEGHTITNRNNRLDVQNRMGAWFSKYLR